MTVATDTEKNMQEFGREEKIVAASSYGCEVLMQDTTIDRAKDSSLPNDAYLIWYNTDGTERIDLVRGTKVSIFDMYYDKYGPGVVKKIDFGYGRTNPKLWGYKQPDKKKKR